MDKDLSLREWKDKAHKKIDAFWKTGIYTRSDVYGYLAFKFKKDFHISTSTIEECEELCRKTISGRIRKYVLMKDKFRKKVYKRLPGQSLKDFILKMK